MARSGHSRSRDLKNRRDSVESLKEMIKELKRGQRKLKSEITLAMGKLKECKKLKKEAEVQLSSAVRYDHVEDSQTQENINENFVFTGGSIMDFLTEDIVSAMNCHLEVLLPISELTEETSIHRNNSAMSLESLQSNEETPSSSSDESEEEDNEVSRIEKSSDESDEEDNEVSRTEIEESSDESEEEDNEVSRTEIEESSDESEEEDNEVSGIEIEESSDESEEEDNEMSGIEMEESSDESEEEDNEFSDMDYDSDNELSDENDEFQDVDGTSRVGLSVTDNSFVSNPQGNTTSEIITNPTEEIVDSFVSNPQGNTTSEIITNPTEEIVDPNKREEELTSEKANLGPCVENKRVFVQHQKEMNEKNIEVIAENPLEKNNEHTLNVVPMEPNCYRNHFEEIISSGDSCTVPSKNSSKKDCTTLSGITAEFGDFCTNSYSEVCSTTEHSDDMQLKDITNAISKENVPTDEVVNTKVTQHAEGLDEENELSSSN